jgi:hypothetical protein
VADARPYIVADVWLVLASTDAVVALVKLYVTAAADDALDHVKLIDVAFAETALQLSTASVGAETRRRVQGHIQQRITTVVTKAAVTWKR